MLHVSDLLLEHREITTFAELVEIVKLRSKNELYFRMDLKPPYGDTPENWEMVLEGAFSGYNNDAQ